MNLERLIGPLDTEAMLQSLREVIAEPTSNLTLSVLLISVVSLVLLILVVVILLFVVGGDEDDEDDEDAEPGIREARADDVVVLTGTAPKAQPRLVRTPLVRSDSRLGRVLTVAGASLVPLMLFAAFVVSYGISSRDAYCLTCHSAELSALSESDDSTSAPDPRGTGAHAGVACVDCHERGQIAGAVGNTLDRSRHLVAFAVGRREGSGGQIPTERCLGCHDGLLDEVVANAERGLLMSHAEPVEAGVPCGECHRDSGHRTDVLEPGMSACLRCHDDVTAAAACETCHTKETSFAARDRRVFVATDTINKGDCGGCHAQDTCDACHGMRMPHDIEFLSYEHARSAGFDKKEFCWRCHTQDDCGKCHQVRPRSVGYWGHTTGDSWKREHYNVPPNSVAGCGCHGRSPYVKRGVDYCLACHEPGIR